MFHKESVIFFISLLFTITSFSPGGAGWGNGGLGFSTQHWIIIRKQMAEDKQRDIILLHWKCKTSDSVRVSVDSDDCCWQLQSGKLHSQWELHPNISYFVLSVALKLTSSKSRPGIFHYPLLRLSTAGCRRSERIPPLPSLKLVRSI